MFDRDSVMIENISAELTISRPSEIAVYDDVFRILHRIALHGDAALGVISNAMARHDGRADPRYPELSNPDA